VSYFEFRGDPREIVVDVPVEFRCSRCGCAAQAVAHVVGKGFTLLGVRFREEDQARVAARAAVDLCRCPRCGHRRGGAQTTTLAFGTVIGLGAGAVVWGVLTSQYDEVTSIALGLAAFALGVATTVVVRLRLARQRVRFVSPG
jgi:DNA-directed RNA polymerase subunit RPC12/RpoP